MSRFARLSSVCLIALSLTCADLAAREEEKRSEPREGQRTGRPGFGQQRGRFGQSREGQDRRFGQGRESGNRPGGFGGQRGGMGMNPIIAALDANRDGELSKEEIANASKALAKLDKNTDGKLDATELRPQFGRRSGDQERPGRPGGESARGPGGDRGPMQDPKEMAARMMKLDRDNDGKLSKTEVPERMQQMFGRADQDGDGFLSKTEVEKVAEFAGRMRSQGKRPGKGGKRGGPEDPAINEAGGTKPKRPSGE